MPTYDYRCNNCGHEFEILQKMSDDHLKSCPKCSQETLKRLLGTGAGILFKGSGFIKQIIAVTVTLKINRKIQKKLKRNLLTRNQQQQNLNN